MLSEPDRIIDIVARFWGLEPRDLRSPKKSDGVAFPRFVAMHLLRHRLRLTTVRIGELLGGRDHTTVLHGLKRVRQEIGMDPRVRTQVEMVEARIGEMAPQFDAESQVSLLPRVIIEIAVPCPKCASSLRVPAKGVVTENGRIGAIEHPTELPPCGVCAARGDDVGAGVEGVTANAGG
jgi:hypothetical protein